MSQVLRQKYENALKSPYVQAFLYMLAKSEGTEPPKGHGYYTLVGGSRLGSLARHPNKIVTLSKTLQSSAAGRYQFLSKTWATCQTVLGLPDFSPTSQDLAACYLIDKRGGLVPLLNGDVKTAIAKCRKEWASLPGAGYGQPEHTLSKQLGWYNSALKGLGIASANVVSSTARNFSSNMSGETLSWWFAIGGILSVALVAVIVQHHK